MMDRLDIYHEDVVTAFALAWASIDGKSDAFLAEMVGNITQGDPSYTGHYEGYMYEAQELLKRAGRHLAAFDLWERLSP